MPPSKTTYVLEESRRYLREKHARDPERFPAQIKAIAAEIGVARGAFYKPDPAIAALVREIEQADNDAKRGGPVLALTAEAHATGGSHVSLPELERQIREGL